jgi:thiol:disulfide interchange protein
LTNDKIDINGEIEYMVCDDKQCLPPTFKDINFSLQGTAGTVATASEILNITEEKKSKNSNVSPINEDTKSNKGLLSIFILSFLGGIAALLTPCVFPLIPMTVSYFTKQSKTKAEGIKNAIFYGLSIIGIYVLLGTVVTALFGADSLNILSTDVWFNIIFFALLVFFAVSFFGAFEIVLPSSWATKIDAQADRGGIIGIIFMALALAIVSFSCTGPIVGTLLVEAASKGGIAPIIGMVGFSSAIALPFTLFAAFPGWMNSLPKSGGWLTKVKVTLGFLELALAFKFLSNADLVLQKHLLQREVFIGIWIIIFGSLALYLIGFFNLFKKNSLSKSSKWSIAFGILSLAFTIYLLPGIKNKPLNFISGFPPPINYSIEKNGWFNLKHSDNLPEGVHYGPHNILSYNDYEKGLAYAKEVGKPILIDFTGHACVNCRKMEEFVWSDEKVLDVLKNDIVLVSLYVDDRRQLPDAEENISKITNKKFRFIGQKWSEFQTLKYNINAQPFYVLIDHEGNNLTEPSAYNPNVDEYLTWLKSGVANFQK